MTSTLNKVRYFELLKKQEMLQNQDKSLLDENPIERRELLSYGVMLENQIYYNRKAEYTFLVEEYLKENEGEAGARMFQWDFCTLFKEDNQAVEIFEKEILEEGIGKLENFEMDSKSKEFSVLINDLFGSCEFLTFNPEDSSGITVEEFKSEVKKTFLEMKKYSNVSVINGEVSFNEIFDQLEC